MKSWMNCHSVRNRRDKQSAAVRVGYGIKLEEVQTNHQQAIRNDNVR